VIILDEPTTIHGQTLEVDGALVLDPRCLIRNHLTGEVAYNPRDHYDRLEAVWREWLDEHPNWPARKIRNP
jgi:hypothetical protein